MKKITATFVITSIEQNNWEYDDDDNEITTAWALTFSLHGVEGFTAFLSNDGIQKDYADFGMIESEAGDLHESFCEALDNNWEEIKKYILKWDADKNNG